MKVNSKAAIMISSDFKPGSSPFYEHGNHGYFYPFQLYALPAENLVLVSDNAKAASHILVAPATRKPAEWSRWSEGKAYCTSRGAFDF
jgi:hypothetical protein